MQKYNYKEIISSNLWSNNVVFAQMLALCPLLAVTSGATNGLGLGLITTAVMFFSSLLISLIRPLLTPQVRIPVFILLIATLVTIADLAMNAWLYEGGGQALWDEVYEPFGLKALAGGNTGMQMTGWFRKPIEKIEDFKGLNRTHPFMAFSMLVFMLSLAGIPPTAGFVGKFYLFNAAVASGWVWLALVGVIMSVVSAYYYLGVVVAMYMRDPVGEDVWAPVAPAARLALGISVALTLVLGIYPAPLLTLARAAARSLL